MHIVQQQLSLIMNNLMSKTEMSPDIIYRFFLLGYRSCRRSNGSNAWAQFLIGSVSLRALLIDRMVDVVLSNPYQRLMRESNRQVFQIQLLK